MKKTLFFLFALLLPLMVSAQSEKKTALYFYADWCPHCQKVNQFFQEQGFYDRYDVRKLNIDKKENQGILAKIYASKGYGEQGGIPAILIDEELLVGDQEISSGFESKMEQSRDTTIAFAEGVIKKNDKTTISLTVLVGAALVDAINPCAFAVLILLVATVLGAKGRNQALASGMLFSASIFVAYFLMGLGLYKVITVFNLPKIISMVVGGLAVVVGLANLKDAFWHGKGFLMEVPMSWRPRMKAILQGVTSPWGAVSSAFLVSLFLLPCTSGPYVVILGLLAEKVDMSRTLGLLALYNLIFISPMVIITVGMYYGIRARFLENLRQQNLQLLHGIAGVIMLGIGGYLIYSWL